MPLLSVLVPVRDARPWIASSLRSLWRQTLTDLEVIAVDDGSQDGSSEWLDDEARREPRLRVLHTPPRGLPAALAAGLAQSDAPWIARHDADDVSHRRRFERQFAHAASPGAPHVLGTRIRLFPARAHGPGMARWCRWHNALLSHEHIRREVLIDSPLGHGTALIDRAMLERVGGWRECGWPEDADLWVRMAEAGARFGKLPEVLYGWRQHPGSSTRTDPRYGRDRFLSLQLDALVRGALLGRPPRTLIGTGRSLERWNAALAALGTARIEARRPEEVDLRALEPPVVVVRSAAAARDRWRRAFERIGATEMREFIFTC